MLRTRQTNLELSEAARVAAMWTPHSFDERTLELQLACVHPRVCLLAAAAGVGVPDPEDVLTPLSHKKARLVGGRLETPIFSSVAHLQWHVLNSWYT